MKIETTIPRPGVVMQAMTSPDIQTRIQTIVGQYSARIVDVATAQLDDAIRSELIKLGWTPPPIMDSNPRTMQLRSLRMMAEAHRLMAESLRLSGLVDGSSMHRKRAIECDQGADDVERVCKTAAGRQNGVDSGGGQG